MRLAWLKPGLYEMQTLALLSDADRTANGGTPLVEVIPLTTGGEELAGINNESKPQSTNTLQERPSR